MHNSRWVAKGKMRRGPRRTDRIMRLAAGIAVLAAMLVLHAENDARAATGTLAEIETRPGVTLPLLIVEPAGAPAAVALLFPGGNGKVALWKNNPPPSRNFLVRTRVAFAAAGLAAVVDAPSDRRRPGLVGFRHTAEHRADIAAAVAWARARWRAPVWLVGTSRGTVSAAQLGALPGVDGIVLSSSVTEPARRNPASALDAALEAIRVPVLLVHHREDSCRVTPLAGVETLRARLTGARAVETLLFDGGTEPQSGPCRAMSRHGFIGIEGQVAAAIAARIRALTPN
jgi:dienelactone hydrolase